MGDLLERAFGGSALNLVTEVLAAKKVSPAELAKIGKLVKGMKRGGR